MVENISQGECSRFNLYRYEPLNICNTKSSISSNEPFEHLNITKTQELLDKYRLKQVFKVSTGRTHIINGEEHKAKWFDYETFDSKWRLREVLDDEIVIEFDSTDKNLTWSAINETAINLYRAGISFEIWDHKGKSPHLHIHDLPIADLDKTKRATFKKIFIRTYVPLEYLSYVDLSLTGVHLVAIEGVNHWKGCYGVKRLLSKFDPNQEVVK